MCTVKSKPIAFRDSLVLSFFKKLDTKLNKRNVWKGYRLYEIIRRRTFVLPAGDHSRSSCSHGTGVPPSRYNVKMSKVNGDCVVFIRLLWRNTKVDTSPPTCNSCGCDFPLNKGKGFQQIKVAPYSGDCCKLMTEGQFRPQFIDFLRKYWLITSCGAGGRRGNTRNVLSKIKSCGRYHNNVMQKDFDVFPGTEKRMSNWSSNWKKFIRKVSSFNKNLTTTFNQKKTQE